MNEKFLPAHLERRAYVYVRQSTLHQVRHHRDGQQRQYSLADRAREIGFSQVITVDDDLGVSASGKQERPGFARLLASAITDKATARKILTHLGLPASLAQAASRDRAGELAEAWVHAAGADADAPP